MAIFLTSSGIIVDGLGNDFNFSIFSESHPSFALITPPFSNCSL